MAALIIITLVRTCVPFSILRWPLTGALLAILDDMSGVMVFEKFGSGFLKETYYFAKLNGR